MKIQEAAARATLVALGFGSAKEWPMERLLKKINSLKELIEENTTLEDKDLQAHLTNIVDANAKGEAIEIGEGDAAPATNTEAASEKKDEPAAEKTEAKAEDKKPAPKKEPAPPKEKKPSLGVRPGKTVGYHCGAVFKAHGIEKGITDEAVKALGVRLGKEDKFDDNKAYLSWAWHVVNGYVVDGTDKEPKDEQPKAAPTEKKEEAAK